MKTFSLKTLAVGCLVPFLPLSVQAAMDKTAHDRLKRQVEVYALKVDQDKDWLVSRLQMYWKSRPADIYINGETFDHVGPAKAPVPTVRLNGTRSNASSYSRPRLEDVVPFDDDSLGNVTYVNRQTGRMEKTSPAKTGCNIASLNRQIMGIARDAARLYAEDGDRRYAAMAARVFDTYMKGIYYRNVPVDLNHGHQQTLVGMTTFEVIHEDIINELTELYGLMAGYFTPADKDVYDAAFKKWADNIIANGVPHNNWNLFQAQFVCRIAQVLRPDADYADSHGREYYLDRILNRSGIRQWSMKRLADFGFDSCKGIWYESPGYSKTVVADFTAFATRLYQQSGIDLYRRLPVLVRAVEALPQYLFPNRMVCGFGDTHPDYIGRQPMEAVIRYARAAGRDSLVTLMNTVERGVDKSASPLETSRLVSSTFYAPNVSWIIQRTGMDSRRDLSLSLNGSLGNHQHANGISMELYGRGYVLGPDAGIGRSLYSGLDYQEYYSQFPAHNTVCVDGVSAYPVMMSHHGFELQDRWPADETRGRMSPVTFCQVSFLEPETQADQLRTCGIVKTGDDGSGYYIDIFRSRRRDGADKTHDYFYHNLGQTMTLQSADGTPLPLRPTDELAFAGGHLYAYSYLYDKEGAATGRDVKASFRTDIAPDRRLPSAPDVSRVTMTMWMKGDTCREVFKALSPANMEYERMEGQPYDIGRQPVLTYVARQHGEAWTHPFVAVYEPSDNVVAGQIEQVSFFTPKSSDPSAVGICVRMKSGRTDYIFSAPGKVRMAYRGMKVNARYAVVSDGRKLVEG